MDGSTRPKVLSVVGAGRSGTTVLASVLGEVEGITSAGELRFLWGRGVGEQRPCGCGRPPERCEVWGPVLAATATRLASRVPPRSLSDLLAAQQELKGSAGYARALRSLRPGTSAAWPALDLVRDTTATALLELARTTGASVVVDTSKRPLDAAVVAGIPAVETFVLHVVRDPRAVVHSWRRAKSFTADGETRTMGTRGLASTVRRWSGNALYAEALRRRLPARRWLHVRYEDFATRPREVVDAVLALLGEPGPAPFVDDHTVRLHPNHIVAGNPSRFTTGEVAISPDEAWRRDMAGADQRLVVALTLPLLVRHGYLRRPGAGGRRSVAARSADGV